MRGSRCRQSQQQRGGHQQDRGHACGRHEVGFPPLSVVSGFLVVHPSTLAVGPFAELARHVVGPRGVSVAGATVSFMDRRLDPGQIAREELAKVVDRLGDESTDADRLAVARVAAQVELGEELNALDDRLSDLGARFGELSDAVRFSRR